MSFGWPFEEKSLRPTRVPGDCDLLRASRFSRSLYGNYGVALWFAPLIPEYRPMTLCSSSLRSEEKLVLATFDTQLLHSFPEIAVRPSAL